MADSFVLPIPGSRDGEISPDNIEFEETVREANDADLGFLLQADWPDTGSRYIPLRLCVISAQDREVTMPFGEGLFAGRIPPNIFISVRELFYEVYEKGSAEEEILKTTADYLAELASLKIDSLDETVRVHIEIDLDGSVYQSFAEVPRDVTDAFFEVDEFRCFKA